MALADGDGKCAGLHEVRNLNLLDHLAVAAYLQYFPLLADSLLITCHGEGYLIVGAVSVERRTCTFITRAACSQHKQCTEGRHGRYCGVADGADNHRRADAGGGDRRRGRPSAPEFHVKVDAGRKDESAVDTASAHLVVEFLGAAVKIPVLAHAEFPVAGVAVQNVWIAKAYEVNFVRKRRRGVPEKVILYGLAAVHHYVGNAIYRMVHRLHAALFEAKALALVDGHDIILVGVCSDERHVHHHPVIGIDPEGVVLEYAALGYPSCGEAHIVELPSQVEHGIGPGIVVHHVRYRLKDNALVEFYASHGESDMFRTAVKYVVLLVGTSGHCIRRNIGDELAHIGKRPEPGIHHGRLHGAACGVIRLLTGRIDHDVGGYDEAFMLALFALKGQLAATFYIKGYLLDNIGAGEFVFVDDFPVGPDREPAFALLSATGILGTGNKAQRFVLAVQVEKRSGLGIAEYGLRCPHLEAGGVCAAVYAYRMFILFIRRNAGVSVVFEIRAQFSHKTHGLCSAYPTGAAQLLLRLGRSPKSRFHYANGHLPLGKFKTQDVGPGHIKGHPGGNRMGGDHIVNHFPSVYRNAQDAFVEFRIVHGGSPHDESERLIFAFEAVFHITLPVLSEIQMGEDETRLIRNPAQGDYVVVGMVHRRNFPHVGCNSIGILSDRLKRVKIHLCHSGEGTDSPK